MTSRSRRPCGGSEAALYAAGERDDAAGMPFTLMLSLVMIGAGATIAAIVGVRYPEQLFPAALSLVLGAGVGVAVLAIGLFASSSTTPDAGRVAFLVASAG